jgi:hypothetical protein
MIKPDAFDAFYVVSDYRGATVKFGITRGDARARLDSHRQDGYPVRRLLLTGMPAGMAGDMERALLRAMGYIETEPVRGREYFPGECLDLILMLAGHFPAYWLAGHRGIYAAIRFGTGDTAGFLARCGAQRVTAS